MTEPLTVTYPMTAARCLAALQSDRTLRRATRYLSPREVVKATRQYRYDGRVRRESYVVTFGGPNYREREFIKLAKKAGESFPVLKLQLAYWPKRKK